MAQRVRTAHNRANRERRWLARKRVRPAKREREREEPKVARLRGVPEGRGNFTARVVTVPVSDIPYLRQEAYLPQAPFQALWRRQCRRWQHSQCLRRTGTRRADTSVADAKAVGGCLRPPPLNRKPATCFPVTRTSGRSRVDCKDCSEEATGLKRGRWPSV